MYKRGSKHSLEERGQAVRQVIDQNQSIQRVAKNYETSRTALKTWVRKYKAEGLDGLKKSRMTFFRYICLILLMLTLVLPKIVNANEAFYGHYVPSEASIIKVIIPRSQDHLSSRTSLLIAISSPLVRISGPFK